MILTSIYIHDTNLHLCWGVLPVRYPWMRVAMLRRSRPKGERRAFGDRQSFMIILLYLSMIISIIMWWASFYLWYIRDIGFLAPCGSVVVSLHSTFQYHHLPLIYHSKYQGYTGGGEDWLPAGAWCRFAPPSHWRVFPQSHLLIHYRECGVNIL